MYSHPHRNMPMYVSTHLHKYIDIALHTLSVHTHTSLLSISVNNVSAICQSGSSLHAKLVLIAPISIEIMKKKINLSFSCTEEYISTMAKLSLQLSNAYKELECYKLSTGAHYMLKSFETISMAYVPVIAVRHNSS